MSIMSGSIESLVSMGSFGSLESLVLIVTGVRVTGFRVTGGQGHFGQCYFGKGHWATWIPQVHILLWVTLVLLTGV